MRWTVVLLLLFSFTTTAAAEFRSVAENAVILYDAPSTRATKLFVVSRDLPVELISTDGTWVKVRDSAGGLAWIERKFLSDKRTLIVTAAIADIRERAQEQASLVFQAQQGVLLELVEAGSGSWVRVRHADGSSGYVRIDQIWGV